MSTQDGMLHHSQVTFNEKTKFFCEKCKDIKYVYFAKKEGFGVIICEACLISIAYFKETFSICRAN